MGAYEGLRFHLTASYLLGIGATAASIFVVYSWNKQRKAQAYWNAPFTLAGRVAQLCLYPVKSCKKIETTYLDCEIRGPKNGQRVDREFVLVDELRGNTLISARQCPRMVLIEVDVKDQRLLVQFPNGRHVEVDLEEVSRRNDVKKAILHENKRTDGLDCGEEIASAFSEYLDPENKRQLRLLRFSPELFTERDSIVNTKAWANPVPADFQDHISYADDAAFMINTLASVDDLNFRLKADSLNPISVDNFRPVIVVSEASAYDEDRWLEVRIGDAEFVCYKACSRCILTTVNPENGTMQPEMQPLKKLREYRLAPEGPLRDFYGRSPIFGVYLGLKKPGRIQVGDEIHVRYKPSAF
ncbi:MOSC domain-containing protein [Aphelenchoides besseyi]|nr:MOSC domain-containing protein [Aphelenchoides besseyi]